MKTLLVLFLGTTIACAGDLTPQQRCPGLDINRARNFLASGPIPGMEFVEDTKKKIWENCFAPQPQYQAPRPARLPPQQRRPGLDINWARNFLASGHIPGMEYVEDTKKKLWEDCFAPY
jgi:ribulose bisphosphate carboxylase small subunit